MDINVTPKDCKFFVQPEKGKVICVIENTQYMFKDYINRYFIICRGFMYSDDFYKKMEPRILMPNRFVGIATCAPEDEFNEDLGRKIAFNRAKNKVSSSFFKRANYYIDTLDELVDESALMLNQLGVKLSEEADKRDEIIANMLGEANGVSQNQ